MVEETETNAPENSLDWEEFKEELRDIWTDLKDQDIEGVRHSLEELVERVQKITGEQREQVRRKIQDLAERFDISFGS